MFAVGKTRKHLEVNGAGQPHLGCQLAMPFAWGGVVLLPIAFFGKVLLLVVGLHLRRAERLGYFEHGMAL